MTVDEARKEMERSFLQIDVRVGERENAGLGRRRKD